VRAAYISRLGTADEIRVGELPDPVPAADEVLVRVEAVAVNSVDTYVRSGQWRTPLPGFPFVIGRDLVGKVVARGAAARSSFAVGTRVWCNSLGYAGRQGATSELVVVPMERLYRLPDGLDPVRTVAAFHPAATAYLGLIRHAGGVGPGDTVVVGGASGNIGGCVCGLASAHGARVVALARAEDSAWCESHGAAAVVDYRDEDLRTSLEAETPAGVNVWFDTSGRIDLELAVELAADRGAIVVVAGRGAPAELNLWPFYLKTLRLLGFVMSTATVAELAAAARTINGLLSDGGLEARVAKVLPFSEAAEAHRMLENGVRGRVVLVP
jgi:NADPH:quinone reductase-like Zn-dependent oxidoreductase